MAQNLTIAGASYTDVPGLDIAKTGGGTAYFADVSDTTASASDVASGKYFYTAAGERTAGTASGGGGGGVIITETPNAAGGDTLEITGVDLSNDTVTAGAMLYGTTAHDATGAAITGTIVTKTSSDLTAYDATVTVPAGYYASQATKTVTDENLVAGNIKSGVSIFGVTGSLVGSSWTKIGSTELTVNTTSTTAASAGTISLGSAYYTKDKIIYVRIRDKNGKRSGYFYGTDAYFMNFYAADNKTTEFATPDVIIYRVTSSNSYNANTGQYGVYGYSISSSGTLTIRRRYNQSYTTTINGTFTVDVYALDPPSGVSIFA